MTTKDVIKKGLAEPFIGAVLFLTWIFFMVWALPDNMEKVAYKAPPRAIVEAPPPPPIGTPEERFIEERFSALQHKVEAIENLLVASLTRIHDLEKEVVTLSNRKPEKIYIEKIYVEKKPLREETIEDIFLKELLLKAPSK